MATIFLWVFNHSLDFYFNKSFVVDRKDSILLLRVKEEAPQNITRYFINWPSYATCTDQKLDSGFTPIFCHTDSHYVKNQMNRSGKWKEAHKRTYLSGSTELCHKRGHMKFSSHHEMTREVASWCPSLWGKYWGMSSSRCFFDIVDIAMLTISCRYRVNIGTLSYLVYIFDIGMLTISCLYRVNIDALSSVACHTSLTSLTSSTSRCWRYRVDIV